MKILIFQLKNNVEDSQTTSFNSGKRKNFIIATIYNGQRSMIFLNNALTKE